jgi:hypothetical protein
MWAEDLLMKACISLFMARRQIWLLVLFREPLEQLQISDLVGQVVQVLEYGSIHA